MSRGNMVIVGNNKSKRKKPEIRFQLKTPDKVTVHFSRLQRLQADGITPFIQPKTKMLPWWIYGGGQVFDINEGPNRTNHGLEAFSIGLQTQLKKLLRFILHLFSLGRNQTLDYFSKGENLDRNNIYQEDKPIPYNTGDDIVIQNVSHACQLIQMSSINILTDPVFGDMAPFLYMAQTETGLQPEKLPLLHAILITHNHRDHLDLKTLQAIRQLNQQPVIICAKGDGDKFIGLGFTDVIETSWYEQVSIKKMNGNNIGKEVIITAVPADHWSNRSFGDVNKALVNGYVMTPKNGNGIVYFAGDTAVMSPERMKSISHILYLEMLSNGINPKNAIIYNLEPGGPNYNRQHMYTTHQSAVDSVISAFKIVRDICELDKEIRDISRFDKYEQLRENNAEFFASNLIEPHTLLKQVLTLFMHHNKFELGSDRFKENTQIYVKLIAVLKMTEDQRFKGLKKDYAVSGVLSWLFPRDDRFIFKGAIELIDIYRSLCPKDIKLEQLIELVEKQVHFPYIGESTRYSSKGKQNFMPLDQDASEIQIGNSPRVI